MSKYLKPIASQVVSALTQLFETYLYTVHSFFTSDVPVSFQHSIIDFSNVICLLLSVASFMNIIIFLDFASIECNISKTASRLKSYSREPD